MKRAHMKKNLQYTQNVIFLMCKLIICLLMATVYVKYFTEHTKPDRCIKAIHSLILLQC